MEELLTFRKELDELDEQLMSILARRFAVCRQVAEYKAATSIPMMQPARVAEVKRRAAARAGGEQRATGERRATYARRTCCGGLGNELVAIRMRVPIQERNVLGGDFDISRPGFGKPPGEQASEAKSACRLLLI